MHLLMLTGDSAIAYGRKNIFYHMLKGFSRHWDRISVICPSNEVGKIIKINDNVFLYPSNIKKTLYLDFFKHKEFIIEKAEEIFKEIPFDLITAHVIPPLLANLKAALKLSKKFQVPFISELMHIPCYPKFSNLQELIEKITLTHFLKRNSRSIKRMRIINKNEVFNYLKDQVKFPENNILHIPAFYLDFSTFKPLPNISKNMRQFVFVGRLEKNKGLNLLIDAFHEVIKKYPDVILKIVGDGSLKSRLQKQIIKKKLNKNIEMPGWLPTQEDVAQIYNQSEALIMPSYNEGGPRVTLEAMACKTLVISTRVGIMNEIVKDGENAIFTDWNADDIAAKIIWTLNNPKKTQIIAEEGFISVQKFEYGKALKNYANQYHSIINEN